MDRETAKRLAAQAAADLLPEAGIVGIGTGSTTRFFIDELGRLVAGGAKARGCSDEPT
jgi:ribose 5-phosphate isomerase